MLIVLAMTILIGAFIKYRSYLITTGYDRAIAKCEKDKKDTVDDRIDIKKKQDNVMRFDTPGYIDSLRDGSF